MDNQTAALQTGRAFLELSQETIYLMGGSFILGSLFTIFLLILLDFMRAYKLEKEEKGNE
ncbi:MAG: hypothetical protein SFT92_03900 [Rickettsiales bacterium]|nr:hypothetical protein [Rickettsiales bacterium]